MIVSMAIAANYVLSKCNLFNKGKYEIDMVLAFMSGMWNKKGCALRQII